MQNIWMVSLVVQWVVLIALAVAMLRMRRAPAASAEPGDMSAVLGSTFPNVTVQTLQGGTEPLFPASAKNRVLLFSLSDCPYCEKAYPNMQHLQEAYLKDPSFELVLLIVGNSISYAAEVAAKHNLRFRVVFLNHSAGAKLPIKMAPYGLVLNARNVVKKTTPVGSLQTLEFLRREASPSAEGQQKAVASLAHGQ